MDFKSKMIFDRFCKFDKKRRNINMHRIFLIQMKDLRLFMQLRGISFYLGRNLDWIITIALIVMLLTITIIVFEISLNRNKIKYK
jgi:hypothetical protein